jgi:hypothetical protein
MHDVETVNNNLAYLINNFIIHAIKDAPDILLGLLFLICDNLLK